MTDTRSRRRSRMNRNEQHLFTARVTDERTETPVRQQSAQQTYTPNEMDVQPARYTPNEYETAESRYMPNETETAYTPNEAETAYAAYTPNEVEAAQPSYTPNEAETAYAAYTPNEYEMAQPAYTPNEYETITYTPNEPEEQEAEWQETPEQPDYAAYYSREGAETEGEIEPAFAPPPSMQQYSYEAQGWNEEPVSEEDEYEASNVYHPRQVTWAEDDREEAIAQSELGYQVQAEARSERKKRRVLKRVLIIGFVLALLGGAAWMMRESIPQLLGMEAPVAEMTQEPVVAFVTPEPVKAFDAAPAASVAETARTTIARLSGSTVMENHIATENNVVTRSTRNDGSFDFYLFTAEGRLLCYFEGLDEQDMIAQEHGFYVAQAPWLVQPDGSALIRTSDIEAAINETVFLHPMYQGWAVVESEADGHANFVNADGQLMSSLWFSRTFPFTGEYTLAYVDTGSTAGAADRYLLYVIGRDGQMTRWLAAGHMDDVVAAVGGMAYMSDGALYHLPDTEQPLAHTAEVIAYPDCGAMVVKDPESGKYGLFVNGEQHYLYAYDSIRPLESELVWLEKTMGAETASLTLRTVSPSEYPLPLSHSFVLEKDGQSEYVALSTQSSYPILLDGEF